MDTTEQLIKKLITKLKDEFHFTGEEIADALWLTTELQKYSTNTSSESQTNLGNSGEDISTQQVIPRSNQANKSTHPKPSNSVQTNSAGSAKNKEKASVSTNSGSKESQGLKIGIPDPPSLREPLTFAHALRPLMKQVGTGNKIVLDEAATVQRIAEEHIFIPVLQPAAEPWLDLALVIDESHSMLIWGHTIRDLKEMFKKYGIFRDIRIWGIQPDEVGENLQLFSRMGVNKRLTAPKEIIDPTGRRLILIVSDCVSNIWRKGMMFPVLKDWTQKQPLAILQMLPEWMWRRTALDLGTAVGFKSSIMGAANQELSLHKSLRRSRSIGFKVEERSKIPVITLDRNIATQWSQMLVGKADAVVAGYLLPPKMEINEKNESTFLQKYLKVKTLEADEIVHNFRMTASLLGRELASLLAASPVIVLPVVRLIQESLLPKSNQIQIAEVFLGGLLRPKSASLRKLEKEQLENTADLNPDLVEYEFIKPEIRDIFLDDSPVSDSIDVVNAVSAHVAEQLGVSMSEFMAILKTPQKVGKEQQEDTVKPFAEITARILRKLGGEYIKFAEQLEKDSSKKNTLAEQKPPLERNQSNLYLLLIGIDCYLPNRLSNGMSYRNLEGSVYDIKRIKEFFLRQPQKPAQIFELTSSNPDFTEFGEFPKPKEPESQLPTYKNIVAKFQELTATAVPGDFVYIQYSGYGGQAITNYPQIKGENGIDKVLVPVDIGTGEGQYLRDLELAMLMKKMVDKGLVVTLVIDCCHDGGTVRGEEDNTRSLNTIDETERPVSNLVASPEELIQHWLFLTQQKPDTSRAVTSKGTAVAGMLPEVKDYVVLAACRPSESAYEYAFDNKHRNGVLTYWLVDTLNQSTLRMTYKVLQDRISAKIKTLFPRQTPMLMGEGERLVIGNKYVRTYAVNIMQVEVEGSITRVKFDAGQAQGLRKGAEFAIYSFGSQIHEVKERIAIAEITDLGASDSWAEVKSILKDASVIEQGTQAVLTSGPVKLVKKVRLLKNEDENKTIALQNIESALIGNDWVTLAKVDEAADYQVDVNDLIHQIYDRTGSPIILRPLLKVKEFDAAEILVKRLVHLAKYQSIADMVAQIKD